MGRGTRACTQSHAVTRTHSHTQSHAPSFSQVSNPRASHGFLKGFARLAVRGRRPGPSGSRGPAPFALRVSRHVAPQGAPRAAVGAGSAGTGRSGSSATQLSGKQALRAQDARGRKKEKRTRDFSFLLRVPRRTCPGPAPVPACGFGDVTPAGPAGPPPF